MQKSAQILWQNVREASSHSLVRILVPLSILLCIGTFVFPFWQLYPEIASKPAVPLHYNVHFGVDMFGPWWLVFTPSIVGFIILCINIGLALGFWRTQRVLSLYALTLTPVLLFFLILASLFITFLNLTYD